MPDQRKIYAVDADTGTLRWKNEDLRFLFAHKDSLFASKDGFEEREFFELDMSTGEIRGKVEVESLAVLRETANAQLPQIEFPHTVDHVTLMSTILRKAINTVTPDSRQIGFVECIEKNGFHVFTIHKNISVDPSVQSFSQHLVIVGSDRGDVRYSDMLAERVNVPIPDSCFCVEDSLYYVKEKKILCAINLTPGELQ